MRVRRVDLRIAEGGVAAPAAGTCADEGAFWLYSSGSTGTPKGVRHVHTSPMATATPTHRACSAFAETMSCFSAAKLFFAYGLGNAHVLSDVRRRDNHSAAGPADAGRYVRGPTGLSADTLLRRADALCGDAGDPAPPEKGSSACAVRIRRRGAARGYRQAGEALWRRHPRRRRLDRDAAHLPLEPARSRRATAPPAMPVPGYELRLVDENGARRRRRRNRRAAGARAVGRGRLLEPARKESAHVRGRMDAHRRQIPARCRRPLSSTAAAPTTCSRWRASGCRRSRSSRR